MRVIKVAVQELAVVGYKLAPGGGDAAVSKSRAAVDGGLSTYGY